jgi:hypothetical protein
MQVAREEQLGHARVLDGSRALLSGPRVAAISTGRPDPG